MTNRPRIKHTHKSFLPEEEVTLPHIPTSPLLNIVGTITVDTSPVAEDQATYLPQKVKAGSSPVYVERDPETIKKLIVNSLKERGSNSCQGGVSKEYVKGSIEKNTIRLVLMMNMPNAALGIHSQTPTPVGFLLARKDDHNLPNNAIYIDVVCCASFLKQGGMVLITHIIQLAEHAVPKMDISLSSLPTVLTYYPKQFGFSHRKSCTPGSAPGVHINPADKIAANDGDVLYNNADYVDILLYLEDHGFSSAKDPECQDMEYRKTGRDKRHRILRPVEEQDDSVTRGKFKEKGCAGEGYYMMRCGDEFERAKSRGIDLATARQETRTFVNERAAQDAAEPVSGRRGAAAGAFQRVAARLDAARATRPPSPVGGAGAPVGGAGAPPRYPNTRSRDGPPKYGGRTSKRRSRRQSSLRRTKKSRRNSRASSRRKSARSKKWA